MELTAMRAALRGLSAFRALRERPVMVHMFSLLDALRLERGEQALDAYTALFYALRQEGCAGLGDWLWDALRYGESPYALLAEAGGSDPALENAARRDTETLVLLAETDCDRYIDAMRPLLPSDYAAVLAGLPRWRAAAPFDFAALTDFFRVHGAGLYARYRAFLWEEGKLIPVPDPDCPTPEELLGYELQRGQVEANTRLLLAGRPANNVLLFGDGGTGKSATVKSMLYLPGMEDLRLIEIQKENLTGLPVLTRSLAGRRQKFILFIDDLAFDQDDRTYSSLKTILEGSLERRPDNVAIYATSNRRHLVQETWKDRDDMETRGDIHHSDTMEEKLSLSARFGVTINFSIPNRQQYHEIVQALAARQLPRPMDEAELLRLADRWEIRHGGVSGRTAQQFIHYLAGKESD